MLAKRLRLNNFRNYKECEIEFDEAINIFVGRNAQGKTNIIEAVFYASLAKSYRTNDDAELLRINGQTGSAELAFSRFGTVNLLRFGFFEEKRRQIFLNGHPAKVKDLIGVFNTVLFSPEDLFLIKGAPALRRRFLDREISQANPSYYDCLTKYVKALSQRNALLKKIRERKAKRDTLFVWDEQIADFAARITIKRIEAVKKLNMIANLMQRKISSNSENLSVRYEISKADGGTNLSPSEFFSWYAKKLDELRETDIIRGSTGIGPHHDDLVFEVNGVNLRSFGSQGQQRTGVLALKLSELEFLRSETGEYPVLLLDDVMSELDGSRRRELLAFLGREKIQTIITATDKAYFPREKAGKFFGVENGIVKEETEYGD